MKRPAATKPKMRATNEYANGFARAAITCAAYATHRDTCVTLGNPMTMGNGLSFRYNPIQRNRIKFHGRFFALHPFVGGGLAAVGRRFCVQWPIQNVCVSRNCFPFDANALDRFACGHLPHIVRSDKHFACDTHTHTTTRNGYTIFCGINATRYASVTSIVVFNSLNKRSIYSSNKVRRRRRRRRRPWRRPFTSRAPFSFSFANLSVFFSFGRSLGSLRTDNRVQSLNAAANVIKIVIDRRQIFRFWIFNSASKVHGGGKERSLRAHRSAKQREFHDGKKPAAAAAYSHVISQSPAEAKTANTWICCCVCNLHPYP